MGFQSTYLLRPSSLEDVHAGQPGEKDGKDYGSVEVGIVGPDGSACARRDVPVGVRSDGLHARRQDKVDGLAGVGDVGIRHAVDGDVLRGGDGVDISWTRGGRGTRRCYYGITTDDLRCWRLRWHRGSDRQDGLEGHKGLEEMHIARLMKVSSSCDDERQEVIPLEVCGLLLIFIYHAKSHFQNCKWLGTLLRFKHQHGGLGCK